MKPPTSTSTTSSRRKAESEPPTSAIASCLAHEQYLNSLCSFPAVACTCQPDARNAHNNCAVTPLKMQLHRPATVGRLHHRSRVPFKGALPERRGPACPRAAAASPAMPSTTSTVVTDAAVPEGHKGLHGFLYGAGGAEEHDQTHGYSIRKVRTMDVPCCTAACRAQQPPGGTPTQLAGSIHARRARMTALPS